MKQILHLKFGMCSPNLQNAEAYHIVREADSLHSFRRKLKMHRFTLCFND